MPIRSPEGPIPLRRLASVVTAGLLGAGLSLHPAPAQAAAVGVAALAATDSVSYSTAPECAPTSSGTKGESIIPFDGVARTVRLDRTRTAASYTTRATGYLTGRASASAAGHTRLRTRGSVVATGTSRAVSTCQPTQFASVQGVLQTVEVPVRSWYVVQSSLSKSGDADGLVELWTGELDDLVSTLDVGRSGARLLQPGVYSAGYYLSARAGVRTDVPSTATTVASVSAAIEFVPVGSRKVHAGKARRWVKVGSRNCASNKVRATLTRKARRDLRSVTLYVKNKRRTVLTGRELRRKKVVLKRIKPASYGKVRAVVVTKSGARRTMRSTSWPCR